MRMLKLKTRSNTISDTDPWPDPTKIADLVTHDQENWFHLWHVHSDISEYC